MYNELLWIVLIFGIGVLFSYFHLTQVIPTQSLLDPIPLGVFITSMILTLLSFLYMTVQWIWHQDPDSTVLGMYVLFFSGAILWAPMVVDSVHRKFKSISVLIALWLAASGSIGLFVKACGTEDILLILGSAFFLLHHVILDGIWWYVRWKIIEEQPVFSWPPKPPIHSENHSGTGRYNGNFLSSEQGSHKHYENMDHI
jgi:hypothetical protein